MAEGRGEPPHPAATPPSSRSAASSIPNTRRTVQAPRIEIVEHYAWTGAPHETLLPGLIDLLRDVWRVRRVAVDATGLGETAARLIAVALG